MSGSRDLLTEDPEFLFDELYDKKRRGTLTEADLDRVLLNNRVADLLREDEIRRNFLYDERVALYKKQIPEDTKNLYDAAKHIFLQLRAGTDPQSPTPSTELFTSPSTQLFAYSVEKLTAIIADQVLNVDLLVEESGIDKETLLNVLRAAKIDDTDIKTLLVARMLSPTLSSLLDPQLPEDLVRNLTAHVFSNGPRNTLDPRKTLETIRHAAETKDMKTLEAALSKTGLDSVLFKKLLMPIADIIPGVTDDQKDGTIYLLLERLKQLGKRGNISALDQALAEERLDNATFKGILFAENTIRSEQIKEILRAIEKRDLPARNIALTRAGIDITLFDKMFTPILRDIESKANNSDKTRRKMLRDIVPDLIKETYLNQKLNDAYINQKICEVITGETRLPKNHEKLATNLIKQDLAMIIPTLPIYLKVNVEVNSEKQERINKLLALLASPQFNEVKALKFAKWFAIYNAALQANDFATSSIIPSALNATYCSFKGAWNKLPKELQAELLQTANKAGRADRIATMDQSDQRTTIPYFVCYKAAFELNKENEAAAKKLAKDIAKLETEKGQLQHELLTLQQRPESSEKPTLIKDLEARLVAIKKQKDEKEKQKSDLAKPLEEIIFGLETHQEILRRSNSFDPQKTSLLRDALITQSGDPVADKEVAIELAEYLKKKQAQEKLHVTISAKAAPEKESRVKKHFAKSVKDILSAASTKAEKSTATASASASGASRPRAASLTEHPPTQQRRPSLMHSLRGSVKGLFDKKSKPSRTHLTESTFSSSGKEKATEPKEEQPKRDHSPSRRKT